MTSIRERRTIRKYSDKDVDEALLNELLTTASRAATMGNMQLYSVVVTRSAETKKELAPLHFNQPMVENAPIVLTFCADYNRFTAWCKLRDATPGYDNFLSFINAATDALLLTQNFCTLAEEAGLGTCFLGTTLYNPKGIIELLKLPKLVFPVATITVGYPAESPAQPDRLSTSAFIHNEEYNDYTEEAIDNFYRYKESLEENLNFVRINDKQNLAQVFTDLRYTKKDNEAMSVSLLDALRYQGFIE